MIPSTGEVGKAIDRGGLLFRLLRDERLEGFEKSFKMTGGALLSNRCLMGISRTRVQPDKLFDICRRLSMPEHYLAAFKAQLPEADAIHFGFEQGEHGFIYKAYLEFSRRLYQALERNPREAGPLAVEPPESRSIFLHLAYKWDALDREKCAIAKYDCYPWLAAPGMTQRLAQIYSGHADSVSFDVVKSIVALASGRTGESLMYLEVGEDNNPRASFDINLHAAGLRLREIEHFLAKMRSHYSIPAGEFSRMFDQVRAERLGHVSGGISREGRDFLTIYHEVGSR